MLRWFDNLVCVMTQLLQQLGVKIHEWAEHGLYHRDWSPANFGWTVDNELLVFDLAFMANNPIYPCRPDQLTGTPPYMAITVQQGRPASESSELEACCTLHACSAV